MKYRVDFEWARPADCKWQRHSGMFTANTPLIARANVIGQLKKIGLVAGALAVYEGERIVVGATLPYEPGNRPSA